MQISQVMTRSVDVIDPDMPVGEVAKRMRDEDIGALPVGENDRLVGMVTDRDIVLRAVAMDRAPSECRVRDVMSEKIFYCFEDQSVEEASRVMAEHQVRRLPVLNRDKRLVGIVAVADLARAGDEAAGEVIEDVSQDTGEPRKM
ncbi:MAG: CBS domain-containing protein [Alphaproteobacteria bacterium]|nr:CBS domain-containing protein [Alphaproteobacteria bacterium]